MTKQDNGQEKIYRCDGWRENVAKQQNEVATRWQSNKMIKPQDNKTRWKNN